MSLEQVIAENTAAIRELIAAMKQPERPVITAAEVQARREETGLGLMETKKQLIKEAEVKKSIPAPTETVVSSPAVAEQVTETSADDVISAPLSYKEDIMPLLTKFFAKCGREAAAELLKKYGVAKFSEVTDLVALSSDLNAQVGA